MEQSLFEEIPAGATVTAIEPLPSDPNLRRVRVNGRIVARLRAADVESLELTVGCEWTGSLARRVREVLAINTARRAALTMLGRRALSRGELIERLTRRGHKPAIAARIGDELEADHWIDDAAYARDVAESLLQRRPAGAVLLLEALRRRRIDDDLARRITAEVLAERDPVEQAAELAQDRRATMRNVPGATVARRIAATLARRGFDEPTIAEAMRRIGMAGEEG